MSEQKINHDLVRRANSLLLKPRKPQTNAFSKNFTILPPTTDIDIVSARRMTMCCDAKYNRGRFRVS